MTVHGQHYWAERFAADAAQLEQRDLQEYLRFRHLVRKREVTVRRPQN